GDGLPLWNPYLAGGLPFVADPLSGIWYPPDWLAVLLPFGLGFNLIFWLHLAWAGLGAWRLARSLGSGRAGAWIAGIAYSGSPKLLAHLGLGHLGLVCGMSWAPWALAAARSAYLESPPRLRQAYPAYLRLGACIGLAFLADPRAAFVIGLVTAAYVAYLLVRRKTIPDPRSGSPATWQVGLGAAAAAATGAGLSAALWLPLSEYVFQSTRAGLSDSAAGALALPSGNLLQLMIPAAPVSGEWVTYLGISCLLLAILAVVLPVPERWFWAGIALAGWILALGALTPLYPILAKLVPGMGLVRVPPRMLFLAALGIAVLAGLGADKLLEGALSADDQRRTRRAAVAVAMIVIVINVGLSRTAGGSSALPQAGLWFAAGLAALVWGAAELSLRRRASHRTLAAGWAALLILDLAAFTLPRLTAKPPESLTEGSALAAFLAPRAGGSRVLSLSYSIPQATAVQFGLRLADGVHPLPLRRYWDRMAAALDFDSREYSVTLPPYPGGDPHAEWSPRIDAEELGALNVGWVVSAFPLSASELQLEQVIDGQWLYSNPRLRPRAWVQRDLAWAGEIAAPAEVQAVGANAFEVEAEGPGHLILAETMYPGWRARVDGEPASIEAAGDLWRAVALPAGRHRVRFEFAPGRAGLGAAISLFTLAAVVLAGRRR
ncbi:MAG TPA: hypothetical protein VGA32_04970, partial [Anaerolineales bacterium]